MKDEVESMGETGRGSYKCLYRKETSFILAQHAHTTQTRERCTT